MPAAPSRARSRRALATAERGGELDEADATALLAARGPEVALLCEAADELRARSLRRRGHLRRQPQHQLHERLLLPLRLLRVLEGPPGREPARPGLHCSASTRSCAARRRRGSAARRRSACRAASTPAFTRPDLPRDPCSRPSRTRCPSCTSTRSRRSRSGRAPPPLGLSLAAYLEPPARRRARLAAGHRGRDPGRRGAARALPRQGLDRAVARGHAHGARGRAAPHGDHHVRPRRGARAPGAPPAARCATCSARPAASASSCRCRSCTMEAPIYLKGRARAGPTFARGGRCCTPRAPRSCIPHIVNVQASWIEARARRARASCSARASTISAGRS